MKRLLENWRLYMNEDDKNEFPHQIYCDLDGVLVGFEAGAMKAINNDLANPNRVEPKHRKKYDKMVRKLRELGRDLEITPDDFGKNKDTKVPAVRNYMYPRLQDDLEFWVTLGWQLPDGETLWEYIKDLVPAPIILTAPMRGELSHKGKKLWVERNLGLTGERVIVEAEKQKYAISDSGEQQNLLIDDTYKKVDAWEKAGGIAIHHKSTVDSIIRLEQIKKEREE